WCDHGDRLRPAPGGAAARRSVRQDAAVDPRVWSTAAVSCGDSGERRAGTPEPRAGPLCPCGHSRAPGCARSAGAASHDIEGTLWIALLRSMYTGRNKERQEVDPTCEAGELG